MSDHGSPDMDDVIGSKRQGRSSKTKRNGHANGPISIRTGDQFRLEYEPLKYAVDDLLVQGQVTAVTAMTSHGKTTLALSIGGHKANGRAFAGKDTPKGHVLYALIENVVGTQHHYIAMVENWPDFDESHFHFLTVDGRAGVGEIRERIEQHALALGVALDILIVDTAPALSPTDDENDNVQQGDYARALRTLTALPGTPAVVPLCHPHKSPKNASECLPRGGGAFLNEMDNNLTLWRTDETVALGYTKLRMPPFDPLHFRLKPIEATVTKDSKGRPLRAITIEATDEAEREQAAGRERSERDKIVAAMATATPLYYTSPKRIAVDAGLILPTIDNKHPALRRLQRLITDMAAEKNKLIERTGGYYVLTRKGREHAARLGNS
jgi:AAA domain